MFNYLNKLPPVFDFLRIVKLLSGFCFSSIPPILKPQKKKNFNQESFGVGSVGSAGSSKKLEIIICLDASFITPHSFLRREKNKKLIMLLWSHEREMGESAGLGCFTAL